MFQNVGSKVKKLAKIICWIGIGFSVISAIILFSQNSRYSPTIFPGILTLILGPLFSWIGSWVTYCIGEAAEGTEELQYTVSKLESEIRELKNEKSL